MTCKISFSSSFMHLVGALELNGFLYVLRPVVELNDDADDNDDNNDRWLPETLGDGRMGRK